jgi:hypothetical protein
MVIAIIVLSIIVVALCVLFYFLHKRVEMFGVRTERLLQWCATLNDNDEVLSDEIKKIFHEVKDIKKK